MKDSGKDVRIAELLTHTGRWKSKSTSRALWVGRNEEKCAEGSLFDENWLPDPNLRCKRGYQNANLGLLGYMLYYKFGLEPKEITEIVAYTEKLRELWMDQVKVGAFCDGYDDVAHYKECDGGADCMDGYEEFIRDVPGTCLSGSLAASTEDLLQFLGVMRYGKALGPWGHDLIFQTELKGNNNKKAPFHWGHTLLEGEGWMRAKSGGGKGVTAYVAHMPRGVDMAIISNTKPQKENGPKTPSSGDAVKTAWTAATGIAIVDAQDD